MLGDALEVVLEPGEGLMNRPFSSRVISCTVSLRNDSSLSSSASGSVCSRTPSDLGADQTQFTPRLGQRLHHALGDTQWG